MAVQLVHAAGCERLVVGDLAAARSFRAPREGLPRQHEPAAIEPLAGLAVDA
jgi:hypothetical protein